MKNMKWIIEFWENRISPRCFSNKEIAIAFGKVVLAKIDGSMPPEDVGVIRCTREYIEDRIEVDKNDLVHKAEGCGYILHTDLEDFGKGIVYAVDEDTPAPYCNCDNIYCENGKPYSCDKVNNIRCKKKSR